ncbi:hypothetical protein EKO04_000027 [Ascochyta lentis]|uniref:F-box domain-containing protein n=1 Tax=Ascochyta lentis TaxID=205686 RepID=A0A8H7JEP7_9PLEO|nr:hypothetical protein EKO04_000027 [Ascochyta lentis]
MAAECDHFSNLPNELKYMILSLLPCHSLKVARLVDKEWAVVAASLLFHTVETRLLETENRKISTLIDGLPGGFLDSVKVLCISSVSNPPAREKTENSLLRLLGALPRDTLATFRCSVPLSQHTVGLLLRTQSRLSDLGVSLARNEQIGLPGPNFVRGNLLCLRRLAITVTRASNSTYEGYGTWFSYTPILEDLRIQGALFHGLHYFEGWTLPMKNTLLTLRRLFLDQLVLTPSVSGLSEQMHLPSLRELVLRQCRGTGALLDSFTTAFSKSENSALEMFEQADTKQLPDHVAATKLLKALKKLDVVILTNKSGLVDSLPDLTSLCEVGHTIRAAHISTSHETRYYNVDELRQLSAACPNMEMLCINLPDFHEDVINTEILDDFELSPGNGGSPARRELRISLEILATLPRLRTLRIVNHPLLRFEFTAAERRYRHQQLARLFIAFLAERGSPIQLIVFNPAYTCELDETPVMDSNGHKWPFYSYQKGTVSVEKTVSSSVSMVVAVPIVRKEIGLIEPFHAYVV